MRPNAYSKALIFQLFPFSQMFTYFSCCFIHNQFYSTSIVFSACNLFHQHPFIPLILMDYQQRNQRHNNGGNSQNRPATMSNNSSTVGNRNSMGQSTNAGAGGGPLMGNMSVQADLLFLKQEAAFSRNAIFSLEVVFIHLIEYFFDFTARKRQSEKGNQEIKGLSHYCIPTK